MRSLLQPVDAMGNSWPLIRGPVIAQPADGDNILSVVVGLPLALAGAATVCCGTDTTVSTDWEVRTGPNGTGDLVWLATVTNLLALLTATVPPLTLGLGQDYYIRARFNGATLGAGLWSADVHIRT